MIHNPFWFFEIPIKYLKSRWIEKLNRVTNCLINKLPAISPRSSPTLWYLNVCLDVAFFVFVFSPNSYSTLVFVCVVSPAYPPIILHLITGLFFFVCFLLPTHLSYELVRQPAQQVDLVHSAVVEGADGQDALLMIVDVNDLTEKKPKTYRVNSRTRIFLSDLYFSDLPKQLMINAYT